MKYTVTCSCGHTTILELYGPTAERERKIKWYETYGTCSECYAADKAARLSATCKIVEMHYGEYKRNYSDCDTVPNSYNPQTKHIRVFVPYETERAAEAPAEDVGPVPEKSGEVVTVRNETTGEAMFVADTGTMEFTANISKSLLFKRAHMYTKHLLAMPQKTGEHFDYQATFAMVLREFYVVVKACRKQVA